MQEFSYRIDTAGIDAQGHTVRFSPNADQLAALARRLGVRSIDRLEAVAHLRRRQGDAVAAQGSMRAQVVQACVVTLDPVETLIEEPFEVCYTPRAASAPDPGSEVEVRPEEDDVESFDGSEIDLGATVAEYLALAIDPYPRREGAEFRQNDGDQGELSPFAVLAKLRNNL